MVVNAFTLPDLGDGVSDGELQAWLVEPGEAVSEAQAIAEVETDKSLVEVPAPYDATVEELLVEAGSTVAVGEEIVRLDADEAAGEAADEGESTATDQAEGDAAAPAADTDAEAEETDVPEGRVFAPPRVRRLARELGVDLTTVDGSGASGRLTEDDVRSAAEREFEADDEDETAGPKPFTPSGKSAVSKSGETVSGAGLADETDAAETADAEATDAAEATPEPKPITPSGTSAVSKRSESGAVQDTHPDADREPRPTIATHYDTATVAELTDLRADLEPPAAEAGVELTALPFVLKAVVRALDETPGLTASRDESGAVIPADEVNVGIAVATDDGLAVPVIEHVGGKTVLDLAAELADVTDRAQAGDLSAEETQGATVTVTEFGALGDEYAMPTISESATAALALGAIEQRPVAEGGEVVARETLPLSLAVDSQVIDGADAAAFTRRLVEILEQPTRLLLEST